MVINLAAMPVSEHGEKKGGMVNTLRISEIS